MEVKKILKYRNIWMAIAIIMIMIYHSEFSTGISLIDRFINSAYGGVDIFVFCSGIGGYYAYMKYGNYISYEKSRFKKLFPSYIVFIVIWLIYVISIKKYPITSIFGNLLGIQSLFGWKYAFNWYITFLIFTYLVIPIFVTISNKIDYLKFISLFVIPSIFISLCFINSHDYIIAATRLPLLLLGILFGKLSYEGKNLNTFQMVIIFILMFVGLISLLVCFKNYHDYLWNYGLYWYPFILITPGLCILISYVMDFINKFTKVIYFSLEKISTITFELYLVHIFVFEITQNILPNYIQLSRNLSSFLAIVISILFASLLKTSVKTMFKK